MRKTRNWAEDATRKSIKKIDVATLWEMPNYVAPAVDKLIDNLENIIREFVTGDIDTLDAVKQTKRSLESDINKYVLEKAFLRAGAFNSKFATDSFQKYCEDMPEGKVGIIGLFAQNGLINRERTHVLFTDVDKAIDKALEDCGVRIITQKSPA